MRRLVQGTIPPALSGLTELRMLGLGRNQLTGQLPAFLGTLPHLGSVWLGNNQFSGPVPQAWCDQGSNAAFTVHLEVRALSRHVRPSRNICRGCRVAGWQGSDPLALYGTGKGWRLTGDR